MNKLEEARLRGRRFAAARAARGLTQHELGKRVGATQSLITQIERGLVERSKFDALIMYELGVQLDEETVRFILAARRAREAPQAMAAAQVVAANGTHSDVTHSVCSPPPCAAAEPPEGIGVGGAVGSASPTTTPLPNPPPQPAKPPEGGREHTEFVAPLIVPHQDIFPNSHAPAHSDTQQHQFIL